VFFEGGNALTSLKEELHLLLTQLALKALPFLHLLHGCSHVFSAPCIRHLLDQTNTVRPQLIEDEMLAKATVLQAACVRKGVKQE
jgi:hypothetical protein